MSGSENVLRPSSQVSEEKTAAALKDTKQRRKNQSIGKAKGAAPDCNAINSMVSPENEIGNVSPNATNLSR
jgi:hypothetical protein